jgi:DNA-directed RNA polymerase subunit RPC12/RpoP
MSEPIELTAEQWRADNPGAKLHEFGTQLPIAASFQGGTILLRYYGCRNCGNAFWTEDDRVRALVAGTLHPCPHCGIQSEVVK